MMTITIESALRDLLRSSDRKDPMNPMNPPPILTLPDGTKLLVSTQYFGESQFACELYESHARPAETGFRLVSKVLDATTCREAQDLAYTQARQLYPKTARKIQAPPYLIWPGPNPQVAADHRGRPGWRRRKSKLCSPS